MYNQGMIRTKTWSSKNGQRRIRLYSVWKGFRARCNTPSATGYENYGGRGIGVCHEWDDFDAFRAWALSNGYRKGLTLDRIDNDGDYSPKNCRWVSQRRQCLNKRIPNHKGSNHPRARFTDDQVRAIRASNKTITSLAEEYGVAHTTISAIRTRRNWAHIK